MTIQKEKNTFSSAPSENGMTYTNIPVAYATSVQVQDLEGSPTRAGPKAASYSNGAPNIAVATGAPIIRSSQHPTVVVPARQQHQGGNRRRRDDECCNGHTCCCVTSIVLTVVFLCCILPTIIFFAVAIWGASTVVDMIDDEILIDDEYWNQINNDIGGYWEQSSSFSTGSGMWRWYRRNFGVVVVFSQCAPSQLFHLM